MRFFSRDNLDRLRKAVQEGFKTIRDELDEHRESINQNTNEIQSNYEYLCRLDSKIEKLGERIDELTMFSGQQDIGHYNVSGLTTREKEVFLAIYSAHEPISYREIGRRTGLSENLVICYVANLVSKGVPVLKKYMHDEARLFLDPVFKEHQMKSNIIGINESVSHRIIMGTV